jgi:dihydropteroate synthase
MGVLNVTPDSFSDGGRWLDPVAAVTHGLAMAEDGADIVDVGGESTRPGADHVPEDEELRRVLPVVRELSAAGIAVSIDTMRARVAEAALEAGAVLINDVSGARWDPQMPALLARAGAPFVAVHWRGVDPLGHPTHDSNAHYDDVVAEVVADLRRWVEILLDAGVHPRRIVLDPGLGFSKNPAHNWALLADLGTIVGLGQPVLVGASRKRFLGSLLAAPDAPPVPVGQRDAATAAVSTLAALAGAWCVRVHAVRASLDAVKVAAAVRSAGSRPPSQPAGVSSARISL